MQGVLDADERRLLGYQPGDPGKTASELLAVLGAPETRAGLSHLAKRLAALKASDAQPRVIRSRRQRARRPGWVHDAVLRALADREGPMLVAQVRAAVKALLGEQVSVDSVSWALAADVRGPAPSFVRVARGLYTLVTAT